MPVYELSAGESRAIPGPVNKVTCLVGQCVVVDPTTKPATTTALSTDESFDAEGKGGLSISDIDGSRVYVEYALSPNAPINGDVLQVVVGADNQPVRAGFDDETTQRGVKDVLGVPGGTGVADLTGKTLDTENSVLANLNPDDAPTPVAVPPTVPGPDEAPELHPALGKAPAGDTDGDSPTGGTGAFEDRTVPELKATAKKKGVDLEGATKKADIIAKLRGE